MLKQLKRLLALLLGLSAHMFKQIKTLLALLLGFSVQGCEQEAPVTQVQESGSEVSEVFAGLRSLILDLEPDSIQFEGGPSDVTAALMEMRYSGTVVTLASLFDGTASLYFSNGGGNIGAGTRQPVAEASKSFVKGSAKHLPDFQLVDEYPLPDEGKVHFYLVTPSGVYFAKGDEAELGKQRSDLSPLFHLGQKVISEIRQSQGQ